jgi:hypothetical protein
MTEQPDVFYEAEDGTTYYGFAAQNMAIAEAQRNLRERAVWDALERFADTPKDDPEFWLEHGALMDVYKVWLDAL